MQYARVWSVRSLTFSCLNLVMLIWTYGMIDAAEVFSKLFIFKPGNSWAMEHTVEREGKRRKLVRQKIN